MTTNQKRLSALRAAVKTGAFDSVVLGQRFWFDDPYDVREVHADARNAFVELLDAIATQKRSQPMLVVGDVGAGKTHLLRSLRAEAAYRHSSLCAYAQFDAGRSEFDQHFLAELVSSLDKPVHSRKGTTGFKALDDGVWKVAPDICAELHERWQEEDPVTIGRLVARAADRVLAAYEMADEDLPTVRGLILANSPLAGIRARAKQFLRGEPLTAYDQEQVPELRRDGGPRYSEQLVSLARSIASFSGSPLVFFFDQGESLLFAGPNAPTRAFEVIRLLLEAVPGILPVVAWELARFEDGIGSLPQALQDRLRNGSVQTLRSERSETEIRLILEKRLALILKEPEFATDPANPLDPLPADLPARLNRMTMRNVLFNVRRVIEGESATRPAGEDVGADDRAEAMNTQWEAALLNSTQDARLSDADLVRHIAWAVAETSGGRLGEPGAKEKLSWHDLDVTAGSGLTALRLFALTKDARGGGLIGQAETAEEQRRGRIPVGLRCGPYPSRSTTKTAPVLDRLFAQGGARLEIEDDELRTISVYRSFLKDRGHEAEFKEWAVRARVLESLDIVQRIRTLAGAGTPPDPQQGSSARQPGPVSPPAERSTVLPRAHSTSSSPAHGRNDFVVGASPEGVAVTLPTRILTRHMVALGGSGSGKTTLILRIVEQALLRGVPAVLIDRKGDFAAYADPDCWTGASTNAELAELRKRIAISLYTPGKQAGRPLALRLLPDDFDSLDADDREEAGRAAADGLAQMIGLKETPTDRQRREVLTQAIARAGSSIAGRGVELGDLIAVLNRDAALAAALANLDPGGKHRKNLVPMLEQLRLSRGTLFGEGGVPLDFAALIAPVGGRARLAIVSLGFLPEIGDQQFFVSRLLAEARRFCRMRPSAELQALLVLDEADVYMPAMSKPVTKEPLLDLLRRARSGGMGIVLGTQSPGDLDYKGRDNITTWALGRIQDGTALNKVMFVGEGSPIDVRAMLPQFRAGRFLLRSETTGLCEIQAHRSLIETVQMPEEKLVRLSQQSE